LRGGPSPPPAAFASLTASSKLQYLDFSDNTLPSAAWQYMCPPGRTLPQLQYLDISDVTEADESQALPDTSALVSCFPGLKSLITSMPCSTAQLAPLQRLPGLHHLAVDAGEDDELEGVQALCQLTGLQQLELSANRPAEARILQLTQLTRLTYLQLLRGDDLQELRCSPQVRQGWRGTTLAWFAGSHLLMWPSPPPGQLI
jgi:Leucine-rich repeat (LRR) protein